MTGGDSGRGKQAILHYGCGTCHTIPGIEDANGSGRTTSDQDGPSDVHRGCSAQHAREYGALDIRSASRRQAYSYAEAGCCRPRSSRHRRLSLHSPLAKLELLFYILRRLAGISDVQQSRRRNGRGDSHEYDDGINGLLDDCHTQAELRHHHSNFATRHHSAANPHHLYASETDSSKAAPDQLRNHRSSQNDQRKDQERSVFEGCNVQVKTDPRKKERNQEFSDTVGQVVYTVSNGFGQAMPARNAPMIAATPTYIARTDNANNRTRAMLNCASPDFSFDSACGTSRVIVCVPHFATIMVNPIASNAVAEISAMFT